MTADGRGEDQITHNATSDTQPTWSPDGSTIAFVGTRQQNTDVYLMNPDGSNERHLTSRPAVDQGPNWKPDGTRLVFESRRRHQPGGFDLFTIRPDGTDRRRLTHNDATDWAAAWSPSGERIVFTRARYHRGVEDLVVIRARRRDHYRLAISQAPELEPDWQPV